MGLFLLAGLGSNISADTGEVLYNGIQLPEKWPPDQRNPESMEPMPVPYLHNPPAVIPIDVGRQLFVDDFLIEKSTLTRTFHSAQRYVGNPVFRPETETELKRRGVVYLGHGGVFYDPQVKLFKMFYTAGWRGPFSLATSPDMIHWTRPDLTANHRNELIFRSVDDNSVWLDIDAADLSQRLKYIEFDRKKNRHILYTSVDGLNWSAGVEVDSVAGDYCSFFYNPFRRVWVYSIKRDTRGRNRYYYEHPEFLKGTSWSEAVYWTGADSLDKPEPEGRYPKAGEAPQLYSLNAVAYESIMVGIHYIHRGPNNKICQEGKFPKLTDLELGFSRDGFHWSRPEDRKPFLAGTRRKGDWDRAYVHSTTGLFVVHQDKLVFPYTGFSGMAPDGSRGMYHGAGIGLAFLRRDGFASMDAGTESGKLTTRLITFEGKYLFVNADVSNGRLKAEILDEQGRPIEPYTLAECRAVSEDSTLAKITWKKQSDLETLRGRPVRFHFELTNGSLYAFWVSRNESGCSNGYVGAGGPDFDGVIDSDRCRSDCQGDSFK